MAAKRDKQDWNEKRGWLTLIARGVAGESMISKSPENTKLIVDLQ